MSENNDHFPYRHSSDPLPMTTRPIDMKARRRVRLPSSTSAFAFVQDTRRPLEPIVTVHSVSCLPSRKASTVSSDEAALSISRNSAPNELAEAFLVQAPQSAARASHVGRAQDGSLMSGWTDPFATPMTLTTHMSESEGTQGPEMEPDASPWTIDQRRSPPSGPFESDCGDSSFGFDRWKQESRVESLAFSISDCEDSSDKSHRYKHSGKTVRSCEAGASHVSSSSTTPLLSSNNLSPGKCCSRDSSTYGESFKSSESGISSQVSQCGGEPGRPSDSAHPRFRERLSFVGPKSQRPCVKRRKEAQPQIKRMGGLELAPGHYLHFVSNGGSNIAQKQLQFEPLLQQNLRRLSTYDSTPDIAANAFQGHRDSLQLTVRRLEKRPLLESHKASTPISPSDGICNEGRYFFRTHLFYAGKDLIQLRGRGVVGSSSDHNQQPRRRSCRRRTNTAGPVEKSGVSGLSPILDSSQPIEDPSTLIGKMMAAKGARSTFSKINSKWVGKRLGKSDEVENGERPSAQIHEEEHQ